MDIYEFAFIFDGPWSPGPGYSVEYDSLLPHKGNIIE